MSQSQSKQVIKLFNIEEIDFTKNDKKIKR